jgi:ATP synthase protein I
MVKNKRNAPHDKYLEFVNIAIQMGIIIAAGVFLGIWLDREYPNEYSAFTIGISLLGVFIALYQVIRKVIQMSKDE